MTTMTTMTTIASIIVIIAMSALVTAAITFWRRDPDLAHYMVYRMRTLPPVPAAEPEPEVVLPTVTPAVRHTPTTSEILTLRARAYREADDQMFKARTNLQSAAVLALSEGMSVVEVVATTGVSLTTVKRWHREANRVDAS